LKDSQRLKHPSFSVSRSVYFKSKVEVPRIKHGKRQTIETLINEEALLFAKFLRDEIEAWIPRIASP
jgi:hypothetical protein